MVASAAVLACLSLAVSCCSQETGKPVVLNGDFSRDEVKDGVPSNWIQETYRGKPAWAIERDAGPDGSDCARVDCPTGEDIGLLSQRVQTREGGKAYRLTVQLKTTPGTRATVSCTSYSEDDKWLDADYSLIVATDETEWTKHAAYFRHNAKGKALKIALWCNFQGGQPGSVWFDDVSIEPVEEIPPTRYEPEHPEPVPTRDEEERGFLLFRRNYLNLMCREYNPAPAERLTGLQCFATQGEYEPVSFGVYAVHELTRLQTEVSDLTGADGASIPAANIDVRSVRHLPKRSHYSRKDRLVVPTFLDAKPLTVAARDSGQVWLTVRVPDDAEGGTYRGAVTVSSDDGRATVPLEVRVFPFRLREPADKWFGMYDGTGLPGRATDLLTRYQDMRQHGLTTVGFVGSLGGEYKKDGDMVRTELGDSTLGKAVAAYKEAGFPAPMVWLMGSDVRAFALKQADGDMAADAFADAYTSIVKAVLRHGRLNEWPTIYFQPEDEVFAHKQRFDSGMRQLKLLKEAGALTEMDGPNVDLEKSQETYEFTDMLVYAYGPLEYRKRVYPRDEWKTLIDQRHADGKKLLYYNFDTTGYHPESMRFSSGFYLAATHADGILHWAYSWARDPYGERGEVAGDVQFQYPKTDTEDGGPSLGYEGIREGIDDYKYWHTLRELVDEAKERGRNVAEAEALLTGLFDDLDLSRLRINMSMQGEWEHEGANDRGDDVRQGAFKLPIPWTFEAYDERRLRVAEMIESLLPGD